MTHPKRYDPLSFWLRLIVLIGSIGLAATGSFAQAMVRSVVRTDGIPSALAAKPTS